MKALSHQKLVITEKATSKPWLYFEITQQGQSQECIPTVFLGVKLEWGGLWPTSSPPGFDSTPYSQFPSGAHSVVSSSFWIILGFEISQTVLRGQLNSQCCQSGGKYCPVVCQYSWYFFPGKTSMLTSERLQKVLRLLMIERNLRTLQHNFTRIPANKVLSFQV